MTADSFLRVNWFWRRQGLRVDRFWRELGFDMICLHVEPIGSDKIGFEATGFDLICFLSEGFYLTRFVGSP